MQLQVSNRGGIKHTRPTTSKYANYCTWAHIWQLVTQLDDPCYSYFDFCMELAVATPYISPSKQQRNIVQLCTNVAQQCQYHSLEPRPKSSRVLPSKQATLAIATVRNAKDVQSDNHHQDTTYHKIMKKNKNKIITMGPYRWSQGAGYHREVRRVHLSRQTHPGLELHENIRIKCLVKSNLDLLIWYWGIYLSA